MKKGKEIQAWMQVTDMKVSMINCGETHKLSSHELEFE